MKPTPKPARANPSANPSADGKTPKAGGTVPTLDEMAKSLQELSQIFDPVFQFHKADEHATEDDLRLFWDVRIVRGADTPFAHVTGRSSLPGIFYAKMRALSPSTIEKEIKNKIIMPLVAMFQAEIERDAFEGLAAAGEKPDGVPEDTGCPTL